MIDTPERPAGHPLGNRSFRAVWLGALLTGLAAWMNETMAGWWAASVTGDPLAVGLVQACLTLPVFVLALPSGLLADRLDRRALLLTAQAGALSVALLLFVGAQSGWLTLPGLIGLSLLLGACSALRLPAHSSLLPELVAPASFPRAMALNGLTLHGTRLIGPALAAAVAWVAGVPAVFGASAALLVAAVLVLRRGLAPERRVAASPPGAPLLSELLAGPRFACASPPFRRLTVLGAALFFGSAAPIALLPLLAGPQPQTYALLLTCIGAGAIGGLGVFHLAREPATLAKLMPLGSLTLAASCLLLTWDGPPARVLAAVAHGWGWMVALTSVQLWAQSILPEWIRARGLSVLHMLCMGASAAGSIVWGWVASRSSPDTALWAGTVGLLGLTVAAWLGRHRA